MIVACNKPTEDLDQKNIVRINFSFSIECPERSLSMPNVSRTAKLIESNIVDDLKKIPDFFRRQDSAPYSFQNRDKDDESNSKRKRSTTNVNDVRKASSNEKINEVNTYKNKSPCSVKSFGKNYILKSSVCKIKKSNFYDTRLEENPWLNYYKDIVNQNKNINNDYSFFLKNTDNEPNSDFHSTNYYENNSQHRREIMINRYTENNEMVEYGNNNPYAYEEETVSVDVPLILSNFQGNTHSSKSNSVLSDSTSEIKQQQQIQQQQLLLQQQQQLILQQQQQLLQQQQQQQSSIHQITNQYETQSINEQTIQNNYMYGNHMINSNVIYHSNYPLNQFYQNPVMSTYPYQQYKYNNMTNYSNPQHNMDFNSSQQTNFNLPLSPLVNPNISNENNPEFQQTTNNRNLNTNTANLKRILKNGSGNYSNLSDESLAQVAPIIIKEQSGCRFVQDKVISDHNFGNNILFPYIKNDINELICDPFGNYLFQVLIDVLIPENLTLLLHFITPFFYNICISPHGTRVIQKIIDKIPKNLSQIMIFRDNLSFYLLDICKDAYGNHIIQKFLSVVNYPNNQFIYDLIFANLVDIANTKHGCCVIQKSISEGNDEQRIQLFTLINEALSDLITDQYGNYTIQYLLSNEDNTYIQKIINNVLSNILYLCKLKYSSNVLEKCFESSNFEIQKLIINELVKNDNIISELIADSYGNYVIQKALLVCKDDNYIKILTVIAGNITKIKKQNFGGKLISKLLSTHKDLGYLIANIKKEKPNYNLNEIKDTETSIYSCNNYEKPYNQHNSMNNPNWSSHKKKKKQKDKHEL